MLNVFQDLWRISCFVLILTCNVVNTISKNTFKKCDQPPYYALHSNLKCDAKEKYDSTTRLGIDETMKPDIRLPRIDPIQVCIYLLIRSKFV